MTQSVAVSLHASGKLQVELPGVHGPRTVILRAFEIEILKKILMALNRGERSFASEAAPSQSQIEDWIKAFRSAGGRVTSKVNLDNITLEFDDVL